MSTTAVEVRPRPAALTVLLLASTLTVMAGAVLSPVLPVIRSELGISGTATGLLLTAHGLTIAVASPAVGWWTDRVGLRRPLAAGLLLYGLAGGAGLVVTSYPLLIVSRVLFGLGAAAVFTGTTVALLSLYAGAERDRVMGLRSTFVSLGGLVWPLIGGALGSLSWHGPFGVYLLGVPLGIAALLALPEVRPEQAPTGSGVWPLLRERPVLLGYYGLFAGVTSLLYVLVVFLPLRFAEVGVDDPFRIAVYSIGMSLSMSAVGLVYARLRARLGYPVLLRAAYSCFTVGFLLLAATDSLALLILAPALFGLGMGVCMPALTVLLADAAPLRLRGQVTALSGSAAFLGQFGSPLLFGPLVDATTVRTGFLAAALLAALVLLALPRPVRQPAP
jgi:ACDE family multidrug resistance protein